MVLHVLAHELPEMSLPQRDHPVEAFLLDRPVESLDERIQVRAAPGQPNRLDPGTLQAGAEFLGEDRIAVSLSMITTTVRPPSTIGP